MIGLLIDSLVNKIMKYIQNKLIQLFVRFSNLLHYLRSKSFENQIIETCNNYEFNTTTKYILWNTLDLFNAIIKNKVQGSIVECGVWGGINLVFYQKLIDKYNLKNCKIYGYDTFEGMISPTDFDGSELKEEFLQKSKNQENWCETSLDKVKKNYVKNSENNDNLILIKGKVEDTLLDKNNIPEKISILKLDTCLYAGTKIELEVLFPKVENGGIIIVDNYNNFKGVKKAVDDFFASTNNIVKDYSISNRAVIFKNS